MRLRDAFVFAIRSFLRAFGIIFGIGLACFFVALMISHFPHQTITSSDTPKMTFLADAEGSRAPLGADVPVVLRIDLHGIIGVSELTAEQLNNMLLSSQEHPFDNHRVKALLLHINTPGGDAVASASMYELIKQYKEKYKMPVYVYVDGMCASGGMYVASAVDQIFASSNSVLGSIGVRIGPMFNVSQAMEKWGIAAETITAGKDKDMFNSFRSWNGEDEGESIRKIVMEEYAQFVDVVISGRKKISRDALVNEYGAQVFLAPEAVRLGFADHSGVSYNEMLASLVKAAGIQGPYQVVKMTPTHPIWQSLNKAEVSEWLSPGKRDVIHHISFGSYINSELSGRILYLYQP